MSILVFIEHKNGTLNKTSLEAIAAAQKLAADTGAKATAVVLGSSSLAAEIAPYDLEKVISAENEKLSDYTPDAYADSLEKVIRASNPSYVIMSHTYLARDFAPKVAARFQKGLIGDCIRMNVDGGKATFTRRIFLGKLDADVVADGEPPTFVTFQSGAFRGDQAAKGSGAPVETMAVEVGDVRMKPEAPFQEAKQAVDLSKADIIVAVGRGTKSKDNLALAEKLAEALGGDLAASRPICDAEWLPIDRQIGSSGQTVRSEALRARTISRWLRNLPKLWVVISPRRVPSATLNGCQLIGRLDRQDRRSDLRH